MIRRHVMILIALFVPITGSPMLVCSQETPSSKEHKKSSTEHRLPLLRAKLLTPVRWKDEFEQSGPYFSSKGNAKPVELKNGNKEQAIRLAQNWVEERFGKGPMGTSLEVLSAVRIQEKSGETLYRVIFLQHYKGTMTEGTAEVTLSERTGVQGSIQLYEFAVIDKSMVTIISQEEATKRLALHLKERNMQQFPTLPRKGSVNERWQGAVVMAATGLRQVAQDGSIWEDCNAGAWPLNDGLIGTHGVRERS